MAYFQYDDRYGCRVADESYVAPPTEDELAAKKAAKLVAVLATNEAVMALTPAEMLGNKVRIVDHNAPFTFAQGMQISVPCDQSDTGWKVGFTLWACTSESKYDTTEIAVSRKAFFAIVEKFEAMAAGKDHQEVVIPSSSPVVAEGVETAAREEGYKLFLCEWEDKKAGWTVPAAVTSYMAARKGQRVVGRNKAAEAAIRADIAGCKEDGSFQATAEWFADLFWDHS